MVKVKDFDTETDNYIEKTKSISINTKRTLFMESRSSSCRKK
jgi:hypothetical protein